MIMSETTSNNESPSKNIREDDELHRVLQSTSFLGYI